jgi:23S rRNA (guanine2445-N2)-methyltransferase / 23S rRNA (guanine2069-N7)-methyltransferase
MKLYATAAQGLEVLLASELRRLGAHNLQPGNSGVTFEADTATTYRILLWSRVASRILLPLTRIAAPDADTLYRNAGEIRWDKHLYSNRSFAIDVSSHRAAITHSQHAALRLKDAIVDQFRERFGERPDVDLEQPDLRIHLWLRGERAQLALDLSGPLSKRGYRRHSVEAPLRETLAAGLLLHAGWPAIAAQGGGLFDPMCGSGTLLIEGAWMAGDVAPGLLRNRFGSPGWKRLDKVLWQKVIDEATERRDAGLQNLPPILGRDQDSYAIEAARANLQTAGLQNLIQLEVGNLSVAMPRTFSDAQGLVLTNPPYGERLGERTVLREDYAQLGQKIRSELPNWKLALITAHPELADAIPLTQTQLLQLRNGPLDAVLLQFAAANEEPKADLDSEHAQGFANRLRKNLRHLSRWAAREHIRCWRTYDADLPDYALAIDLYHDLNGLRWIHAQEYAPPKTIDPLLAQRRLDEALLVMQEVLETPPQRIALKRRERQRGKQQYEKQDTESHFIVVQEGHAKLHVNLWDYLDTGLFLDHRITRARVAERSKDRDVLNLFCYTATASVLAATHGARSTTSVDLSNTYLDWAAENFRLNEFQLGAKHRLIQDDVRDWLAQAKRSNEQFDVIFLDPPSFSNSKRMEGVLDIQRDHVELIQDCMALLRENGELIFSTNLRRFKLDRDPLIDFQVEDWSAATLPEDFKRNPRIHQCWYITR